MADTADTHAGRASADSPTPGFLDRCRAITGAAFVLHAPADMAPFLRDWRGRFTGAARAVLRPGSVDEVAQLVRLCA
ncbi:MAG TPA: hypothetical protein VF774_08795, partial [Pseudoduganella sp.]